MLGSNAPAGFVLIPDTGTAAVVDNSADEVFVANSNGVLQARFDIAWFSLQSQGIAYNSSASVFAILDNGNDQVSFLDLPSLVPVLPGDSCECDLNEDGRCDGRDWLLFFPDWGRTDCPVNR